MGLKMGEGSSGDDGRAMVGWLAGRLPRNGSAERGEGLVQDQLAGAQEGGRGREPKMEPGGNRAGQSGQGQDGNQDAGAGQLAARDDVGAGGQRHRGGGEQGGPEGMERNPGVV
jgi:hypothetical protein